MKLDDIRKLHQKKYRTEAGHFLAEGEHAVLELQKAAERDPRLRAARLYVSGEYRRWRSRLEITEINSRQMSQISDTSTPQGIFAVVPILPPAPPAAGERAVFLHEVQDPGNLGTILRSLAWFGGLRCLLSADSADPYNPKAVRASAGAIFHVPIEQDVELDSLRERFGSLAFLDMTGSALPSPGFASYECYVFGNEARGLPREQLTALQAAAFSIAGRGDVESLNLAAAVAICLYEIKRRTDRPG